MKGEEDEERDGNLGPVLPGNAVLRSDVQQTPQRSSQITCRKTTRPGPGVG